MKFILLINKPEIAIDLGYFSIYMLQTCLCNVHPLTPHFYIVKLRFTGVNIIFALKHRLWVLVRTASRAPTINVLSKNKKNITFCHLKITIFTVMKYRRILHVHVFVMMSSFNVMLSRVEHEILYIL